MAEINVKDRIKMLMEQRGMKLSDLAAKCDWPASKITKILNGDQKITTDDLIVIALAIGTNPAILISQNMSDVEPIGKAAMPLDIIFDKARDGRINEEEYVDLLENELPNTMSQYLSIKDAGKSISSYVKYRRIKTDGGSLIENPRVLITDRREGQLFANQLTVGYWFTKNGMNAYLTIHYMKRGTPGTVSPVALQDMREYFRLFVPAGPWSGYEDRMYLDGDSRETRMLNFGTICCIKYNLDELYDEERLKEDLREVYDAYLQLLDAATKRVQETYENIYQSRRAYDRKERPDQTDGTFEKMDLDRILPIEVAPRGRYSLRMRAKNAAFTRADYKCELNPKHETFIDRTTGKQYMEGHMLIPYSSQDAFKSSLEIGANMCCVCPNCHARLEHASDAEKQELLMQLYLKHKDALKEAGIDVTPMQLFKLYGMN